MADVTGSSAVANWLGVEPVMLMCWAAAGWTCVIHILILWWMPPAVVSFFCGDGVFLGNISFMRSLRDKWVNLVTWVERKRTTSVAWWRVLWIFYSLWAMAMQGPISVLMELARNPDTSRLIGMGVILPMGLACYFWVFMNPQYPFIDLAIKYLPSGWIEPPGSTESIVWVTVFTIGTVCGAFEFMNAFYPPIIKLILGDVPLPLFHAGIVFAACFACVMTGIDADGNRSSGSNDSKNKNSVESYMDTRYMHVSVLGVSLIAVAATYIVLPALDRVAFLSRSMRPMHLM